MTKPHGGAEKSIDIRTSERGQQGGDVPPRQNGIGHKLETVELDYSLILRVQRFATGATIHRFSQALTVYMGNVELWNRFVAQGPAHPDEVAEKIILRDRAMALQVQLRQEIVQEELRSINLCGNRFG
jgi:hypothetical protein